MVCEIEFAQMGKNSGNPDLMSKKAFSAAFSKSENICYVSDEFR